MSATDEAAAASAAAAAGSEQQPLVTPEEATPAAEAKPDEAAATAAAAAAEDPKQKEKEEKERVKREKEEQRKREAEEKKREAEEKKRKREEEKQAKAEAKAKAKAEAKAACATESKPCYLDLAIDVANRDRNQINCHVNVQFEDIIAEPDPTVFSFDNVWTASYKVFTCTKLWCYRITSLICAVPAAICWGIEFAMLSFCTIWCWQPSLKAMDISLWYTRRIYEILLKVFVEPCFHAAGKCLSHVVVTVRREA